MHQFIYLLFFLLLFDSCKDMDLHDTYYLNEISYLKLSKNANADLQLEHFLQMGNDTLSTFVEPMVLFDSNDHDFSFNNKKYQSKISFINDSLGLFSFTKIRGELDEAYFFKNNTRELQYLEIHSFCQTVTDSLGVFSIPEGFKGLVFIIFNQKNEFAELRNNNMIFSTTKNLDLRSLMCKKFGLVKNGEYLKLKWNDDLAILDLNHQEPDGMIWGLNRGPYISVLYDLGVNGEVLIIDLN